MLGVRAKKDNQKRKLITSRTQEGIPVLFIQLIGYKHYHPSDLIYSLIHISGVSFLQSIAHIRQSDGNIQTVEEHSHNVKRIAEWIGDKIGVKHIAG